MSAGPCPFCQPEASRLFHAGDLILGLWDAFAVTPGHALLVTKRHVASWFDATDEEREELVAALEIAKAKILEKYSPDGFNIGVNIGDAGGQTIPHLHVHLIPRYSGDVKDPRGGVRWVIPEKANYLSGAVPPVEGTQARVETPEVIAAPGLPHGRAMITGALDPLAQHLYAHLEAATQVDIAVAFVLESGIRLLESRLREFLQRGGKLRVVVGDYLGVTQPEALRLLLDLAAGYPERASCRVFECKDTTFHPKAYLFHQSPQEGVALVGSSNLTRPALRDGVEWNYRVFTARDASGFRDVVESFEQLWTNPITQELTHPWVDAYDERRASIEPPISTASEVREVPDEPAEPPPQPWSVQLEALKALNATREAGNSAGLVVLATGLGKTWLSAFDSHRPEFQKVLFVAHREEILGQAMATFRRIRPDAHLGYFTGQEKSPDAHVLFASVQALSRAPNLRQFEPGAFDYIVVDEFHHASARTYRKLINHFEPKFLLGLTATPERSDGGDLLALCQENLVYRCDVPKGIELDLLCPFRYFGVPDEVDYAQIPWRSNRFEEEALTQAVATQARAQNALEQYEKRAGERTLAFCCSVRHANFMRDYFRASGLRAAAVHSGEGSDPRTASLEALARGELDIVCAVDMFNEGVDVPLIDTVMMLRPTESRLLWLQQFGRGLRQAEGKEHLTVIDYIGNHRIFLIKAQALLSVEGGDSVLRQQLNLVQQGEAELPPGCEVTYELEAMDIMQSLLRAPKADETLQFYYDDFKQRHGVRPRAVEAFHDGYNPRAARQGFGSWLRFVEAQGDLDVSAETLLGDSAIAGFLDALETTPMTKSYKMLVLLGALNRDAFPGSLEVSDLAAAVERVARRSAILRSDVGTALDDPDELVRLLEVNPIAAWVGGKGTRGKKYFRYGDGAFASTLTVGPEFREALQEITRELADWRLAEYLSRFSSAFRPGEVDSGNPRFECKVSHASGRPILFLPDRETHPGLPADWTPFQANNEEFEGKFVKVALNMARRPGSEENVLAEILRGWFGEDAGLPGTSHHVVLEETEDGWELSPLRPGPREPGLELWKSYHRSELPELFGLPFKAPVWNQGFVPQGHNLFLFVTLDKSGHPTEHKYADRFVSESQFEWVSQNRTKQDSKHGRMIRDHAEQGVDVMLFVRKHAKIGGSVAPFIYCGGLNFVKWQGNKPITVEWELQSPLTDQLFSLFTSDV